MSYLLSYCVVTASCLSLSLANGHYAPDAAPCPTYSLLREADGIVDEELRYIQNRQIQTAQEFEKFIRQLQIPGLNVEQLFSSTNARNAKIGLAFSGGGLRSLFTGAGALSAMDGRIEHEYEMNMGGLLQSASYMSGLSGGGWLIGSFIFNGMNPIPEMLSTNSVWNFEASLFHGENGNFERKEQELEFLSRNLPFFNDTELMVKTESYPFVSTIDYYKELHEEVRLKQQAGFETSLTDYWSRALYRKLIHPDKAYGTTWSDITSMKYFRDYSMPFPILLAVALEPKTIANASTSTIVEFTPYEFGSWTPTIGHFSDIRYLGSELQAYKTIDSCKDQYQHTSSTVTKPHDVKCYVGFDNAAFIMGTSSSLFNDVLYFYARNAVSKGKGIFARRLRAILDRYGLLDNKFYQQFALFHRNPFYGVPNIENVYTSSKTLYLADGGADGQNLPLEPLLRPERNLDVIIAIDSTSDMSNYPNGSAVFRPTWRYHGSLLSRGVKYPLVPSELELARRDNYPLAHQRKPKFFGCNLDQFDLQEYEELPPLLVYIPNSFYSAPSNRSTIAMTYSREEALKTIQNGYNVMTLGNSSIWSKCIGCATLLREFQKSSTEIVSFCKKCYAEYCIN